MERARGVRMRERQVNPEKPRKASDHGKAAVPTIVQISVVAPTGAKITVEVATSDTVGSVTAKIQEKLGRQLKNQRFRFGDKQPKNHRTLSHYSVQEKSIVTVL